MGIFVGRYDHINTEKVCKNRSKSWVGGFNPCNSDDMQENDFADNTALRGSITYFTAS